MALSAPVSVASQNLRVDGFEAGLLEQLKWIQKVPEAPTFRPSRKEFQNPIEYIRRIEPEASKTGKLRQVVCGRPRACACEGMRGGCCCWLCADTRVRTSKSSVTMGEML